MKFKSWIKFFGLSFFSDNVAVEARRHGYRNIFLVLVLAFIFFLTGFMCAEVVPFSNRYGHAQAFRTFVDSAFASDSDNRITLAVENGAVKAGRGGETPSEAKIVNTFTNSDDEKIYSSGGYGLIVDTRAADTPIVFTKTAAAETGEKISYADYLALTETEKSKYKLETVYTDEQIVFDEETVAKFEEYLGGAAGAAESYGALQSEKDNLTAEEYGARLYALYAEHYFGGAESVVSSSKVPVLRDYYYFNYVLARKTDYLYIFGDIVYGSFSTDAGVRVTFGGFTANADGGEVTDAGEFLKQVYYGAAGYAFATYFLNAMMQLPLIAVITLAVALMLLLAGKAFKSRTAATYGESLKIVGAFVWVSALLTGILTFALGFALESATAYSLMLPVYALILTVRTVVFGTVSVIKERKENKSKSAEETESR